MPLQEIAEGARPVPLLELGRKLSLVEEIQTRLGDLGLLDPPADRRFATVSQWALDQFLRKVDLAKKTEIDRDVARALLNTSADDLFPLKLPDTFAGRLTRAILQSSQWLCRHPDCVNIVYVEGMDIDHTPNRNTPNEFNDLRLALRINRAGNPDIVDEWEGTTEPGKFFTTGTRAHKDGAARIAFGQYKAWVIGTHRAGSPSAHEALVQVAPIKVFRDLDANFIREGDKLHAGIFGINQHWGFDLPKTDIRSASAGCLVGRTKAGHRAFMSLCKSDPRFQVNNGYRFMATVLPAEDVSAGT
jgi:hypothetical protein